MQPRSPNAPRTYFNAWSSTPRVLAARPRNCWMVGAPCAMEGLHAIQFMLRQMQKNPSCTTLPTNKSRRHVAATAGSSLIPPPRLIAVHPDSMHHNGDRMHSACSVLQHKCDCGGLCVLRMGCCAAGEEEAVGSAIRWAAKLGESAWSSELCAFVGKLSCCFFVLKKLKKL